ITEIGKYADHHFADVGIVLDDEDRRVAARRARAVFRHRLLSGQRTVLAGDAEAHRRAATEFTFDLRRAARLLGETVDLAQAQSGAFADLFGRVEGLKGARHDSLAHAASGIADRDDDIVAGGQVGGAAVAGSDVLGSDRQPARAIHRIAGVDGEVEDRGLELGRIYAAGPGIGLQSTDDLDPFADGLLTQYQGLAQDVVGADGLRPDLLAAREGQQVLRQPRAARRRAQRRLGIAPSRSAF